MVGRVAVIGDITGHPAELRRVLEGLGTRFDGATSVGRGWRDIAIGWPDDLHVVQVGDLIHRGPDSLGVVLLVDRLIARGAWTQVVGNHEQLYVDRPVFVWPERIDDEAVARLRAWWADGRMAPGAIIETASEGDWLVTHAGLTAGFWEHGLGAPTTAGDTLAALREAASDGALWHPGRMLTGTVDFNAGPVWADAGAEVYPSWQGSEHASPFHQAHGHSTAYDWDAGAWLGPRGIRPHTRLDEQQRLVTFTTGERRFVGTDPGHGAAASPVHGALVLHDAAVRTR
ncbi:MAG: metallophosphoesterase [Microbacterium sp.]